ncbi:MAG: Eco57I restriction-modification methylase domain-containing protein [Candidatus Promineofilum sp.]|jgi:hypothetical protein|nr:Eco57I restriction-modification methylase domain-containing protein [Promineifilum sp.]
MNGMLDVLEEQRLILQAELDSRKTQSERNRLGQFATPTNLATEILKYAATLVPNDTAVSFLDPAIGTGAFYSALRQVFPESRIKEALGFEIDAHYGEPATQLWRQAGLVIKPDDFTLEPPAPRFDLVICNPPYVRHHHLQNGEKARLQARTLSASKMKLSGLAGLYSHFLGLAHAWMTDGAVAGWLIPSEFMDVNYGRAIKHYLLNQVTLLHIHRFDPSDVQFADALVSSAIVWFRNTPPPEKHSVTFSLGGTLLSPQLSRDIPAKSLARAPKWTRFPVSETVRQKTTTVLSDFFRIKRGLVTGDNHYFVLTASEITERRLPIELFRPILPSPRYLPDDEILADEDGLPLLKHQLFLLDTRLSEEQIQERYPHLSAYLQIGKSAQVHERYICRHRSPWYSQETRPPAPIVCTYLGRSDGKSGRPFRFILNHSDATVANVYLAMYPTARLACALRADSTLLRRIWLTLNRIAPEQLLGEGRVYGGGLHKLEPNELANVDATSIAELVPGSERAMSATQLSLF